MHQLCFTEQALAGFDSRFHVRPPLRSEADRQALVAGVRDGVIDAIVSQHQPHDSAAKQAPLPATEPGLSSIESVLSLGLDRKSTRLNSSHVRISYAVFCLKKKI